MPITTGNDTINGGALTTNIDGLAGNDLLLLNYGTSIGSQPILELRLYIADALNSSTVFLQGGTRVFNISNIERFQIVTGDFAVQLHATGSNANFHVTTGAEQDHISVGLGANVINTRGGSDFVSLVAGGVANTVFMGIGDDSIYGAEAHDIIDGSRGIDTVVVDLRDATTGANINILNNPNWTNVEQISGYLTDFDDRITAGGATPWLYGGDGIDWLILDFTAQAENSSFISDLTVQGFEVYRILGNAGNNTIRTGSGADVLRGGGGGDMLDGGAGLDTIYGGSGNDTIITSSLTEVIDGGTGQDTVLIILPAMTHGVRFTREVLAGLWTGVEDFSGTLTPYDDLFEAGALTNDIWGGRGHDTLGLDYSDVIMPTTVREVLFNFPGNAIRFTEYDAPNITGFDGWFQVNSFEAFNLIATNVNDYIWSLSGNDTLRGAAGDDYIGGAAGNDLLFGDTGNDTLGAGIGHDRGYGGDGSDEFRNFGFDDTLRGGAGTDTVWLDLRGSSTAVRFDLHATDAVDWFGIEGISGFLTRLDDVYRTTYLSGPPINGGAGVDTLILDYSTLPAAVLDHIGFSGGSVSAFAPGAENSQNAHAYGFENYHVTGTGGDDGLFSSQLGGRHRFLGRAGDDTLETQSGSSSLYGGLGEDTLKAGNGRDLLYGGAGNDDIFGDAGAFGIDAGGSADTLFGGSGADFIVGGAGADLMDGGTGADLFYFQGSRASGSDTINNFAAGADRIWIGGGLSSNDVTVRFLATGALISWSAGTVLFKDYSANTVALYFDSDFY